jgi:hypothetical protein
VQLTLVCFGNVAQENMIVNENGRVWIEKNQAGGNLICRENVEGAAVDNWAAGTEDCRVF